MLTLTQSSILNAVSDDYEDLERIYKSICLEFSSERYNPSDPTSFYWREGKSGLSLAELADNLVVLVDQGLLEVRMPNAALGSGGDFSYVWKGWFGLTSAGRRCLLESENRNDVS